MLKRRNTRFGVLKSGGNGFQKLGGFGEDLELVESGQQRARNAGPNGLEDVIFGHDGDHIDNDHRGGVIPKIVACRSNANKLNQRNNARLGLG